MPASKTRRRCSLQTRRAPPSALWPLLPQLEISGPRLLEVIRDDSAAAPPSLRRSAIQFQLHQDRVPQPLSIAQRPKVQRGLQQFHLTIISNIFIICTASFDQTHLQLCVSCFHHSLLSCASKVQKGYQALLDKEETGQVVLARASAARQGLKQPQRMHCEQPDDDGTM